MRTVGGSREQHLTVGLDAPHMERVLRAGVVCSSRRMRRHPATRALRSWVTRDEGLRRCMRPRAVRGAGRDGLARTHVHSVKMRLTSQHLDKEPVEPAHVRTVRLCTSSCAHIHRSAPATRARSDVSKQPSSRLSASAERMSSRLLLPNFVGPDRRCMLWQRARSGAARRCAAMCGMRPSTSTRSAARCMCSSVWSSWWTSAMASA